MATQVRMCGTLRGSDPFRYAAHGMAGQSGALGKSVSSSEPRLRRVTVMATRLNVGTVNEAEERLARLGFGGGGGGAGAFPSRQNRW